MIIIICIGKLSSEAVKIMIIFTWDHEQAVCHVKDHVTIRC